MRSGIGLSEASEGTSYPRTYYVYARSVCPESCATKDEWSTFVGTQFHTANLQVS